MKIENIQQKCDKTPRNWINTFHLNASLASSLWLACLHKSDVCVGLEGMNKREVGEEKKSKCSKAIA